MRRAKFLVTTDLPAGCTPIMMREYIETAIMYLAGRMVPESPLFKLDIGQLQVVRFRPTRQRKEGPIANASDTKATKRATRD